MQTEAPRQLRAATTLLWAALAVGIAATAVEYSGDQPDAATAMVIVLPIDVAFILLAAVSIRFFSLGRSWARLACAILFALALLGVSLQLQALLGRSAPMAALSVVQVLLQAGAMYLAFTEPLASYFRQSAPGDAAMRMVLPVGRSGWAIAAGYLALFSVLLVPAPFALLTGILAVRDIRRHPGKHGMGRAVFGIVMGSLGIAAVVGLFLMWR